MCFKMKLSHILSGLIWLCLWQIPTLQAQPAERLTLEEAYSLLEQHYPALKNEALLEEMHRTDQNRLGRSRLPALYLKADGRLQSDNVHLDVPPGVMLPFEIDQPLYAARSYFELQYTLLDGGLTNAQRSLATAQFNVDQQTLNVERYTLRERINALFLNIELLRAQVLLFDYSLQDLAARKERLIAGVENGVVLESDLKQLEVRELELKAGQDNLTFSISGLIQTLSDLIGQDLSADVALVFPALGPPSNIPDLNRPEQVLLQHQQEALLASSALMDARKRPHIGTFAQAGYGYPNPVNFLDQEAAPYGIVGLQLSWHLIDWNQNKLEKQRLALQAQQLEHAEETFEFNIASQQAMYFSDVARLEAQIEASQAIAQLQADILAQMAAQLDEGVITSADYLAQVNAELKARQNLVIHQTELLQTQLEFWNSRGHSSISQ